ncbi:DMT family transporter [Streptococcus dentiloxodontae]
MAKQIKGSLMVLAAGIAWGISGVSGQYLMAHGMNVNLLTALRLSLSGLFLLGLVFFKQKAAFLAMLRDQKALLRLVLFAFLGLLMNQYAYLKAVQATNAGTATVLQYTTPIFILTYVCIRHRTRPTVIEFLTIAGAVIGTYLMATHGQWNSLAITPEGLFWGLLSAVSCSLYILIPVKLIQKWGSLLVIEPAMLIGGSSFSIMTQCWQYECVLTFDNTIAFFGLIGIGTIFAYTVFLKGTSIIGAVKGSLLPSVEPISSVIFVVFFMGEIFYPADIFGIMLIIVSVSLISIKDLLRLKRDSLLSRD